MGGPKKSEIADSLETLLYSGDYLRILPTVEARLSAIEAELRAISLMLNEGMRLLPDPFYTSAEAARFLGMTPGSVNKITEFPHPGGRFRGIHLMAFRGDITFEQAEAYLKAKKTSVLTLIKSSQSS